MDGITSHEVSRNAIGMYFVTAMNNFLDEDQNEKKPNIYVNFTMHNGVTKLQRWHEHLAHICSQHVMTMAARSLVEGLKLQSRDISDCEACNLGKQNAKPLARVIDRDTKRKHQSVFVDMLFPVAENGTSYSTILVIIDAFTRYITAYPLKSKGVGEVKAYMKRYMLWADRPHKDFPRLTIDTSRKESYADPFSHADHI
ncbi:Retrovirus-related pol Polyprotein [Phytophthora megakarya]|uniref:Retrovirus-related pol Polyprotein n=1 Tax=Phytophthora megakarya TaxID=4795 RepID=A0A225WCP0_9STRA|nr:Retrovirus-related pol Polyprotein [Phytophthora megakarya]